jgi:hypothetical protein
MFILSLWPQHSAIQFACKSIEKPKSAALSLLPPRVVERSREEMDEKRALILGKALLYAGVHLFLKGGGDLFQRSTSFGQKNALNAPIAWIGLALDQL